MKQYRFTFTKWLILLTALLALMFCFAACSQDEAPPTDSDTCSASTDGESTTAAQEQTNTPSGDNPSGDNPSGDTPPADDHPIVTELPLVSYQFISNGDGTCSIGGIITNPENDTQEVHLDIPETSPDGDTVTAINGLSLAGSGNIPRMILKEDYEKIDAAWRQKVETGEISEFYYMKYFNAVYTLNDPDQASSRAEKEQMIKTYPITAVSPIYVIDDDLKSKDFTEISRYLSELVGYDMYDAIADYNHMVEVAKASERCTPNMLSKLLSPYANENTDITSVSIPNTVLNISSTAFNHGFEKVIQNESGVLYLDKWVISSDQDYADIVIRENVVGICEAAFESQYYYSGLKSIVLPNSLKTISASAFADCNQLTEINLPESLIHIGELAFTRCINISDIMIPKNVEKIGNGAFSCGIGLTNIQIDSENTAYYVKNNCLINKKTQTLMAGCKSSIIPDDNTVKSIAPFAFYGCELLTNISIPSSVTAIGESAFANCHSLICTVVIPDGVERIESASFENCYRLPNVILPKNLTSIAYRAFYGCYNLTSITIPENVTAISEIAFDNDGKLYEIINQSNCLLQLNEKSNTRVIINADGSKQLKNNEPFEVITIDKGFRFTHYNGKYQLVAYLGADENITFPDHINGETYTVGNMSGYLRNIVLSTGVTAIEDHAFQTLLANNRGITQYSENTALTSVVIPDSVKSIGKNAFAECYNLESVIFTGNMQLEHVGINPFTACNKLTTVILPDSTGDAPYVLIDNCLIKSATNTLILGNKDSIIPNNVTNVLNSAFSGYEQWLEPENGVYYIDNWVISADYDYDNINIALKENTVGIASLATYRLEEITIPNSVRYINNYALNANFNLIKIKYQGTMDEWNAIEKGELWAPGSIDYTISCTDGEITKS